MSEAAEQILKVVKQIISYSSMIINKLDEVIKVVTPQRPLSYKVYKGVKGKFGALRFSLQNAYWSDKRPDGVVFMDMCAASGPNNYNWEDDKITMALGVVDITKIIAFLRKPDISLPEVSPATDKTGEKVGKKLTLFHDRNAGTAMAGKQTTCLEINKYDNKNNFFWRLTYKNYDETKSATVPVSLAETVGLVELLKVSIPAMLNW